MVRIKTAQEIDGIRKSSRLAADALVFAGTLVKVGVSTAWIDDAIASYVAAKGGRCACLHYKGFPKSVCTSVNDVICHGIPGSYRLRGGDILKIDIITELGGFYGDTCGTFTVGQVSKKALNLIECAKKCLEIGIAQVKPGVRVGKIGFEINKHAWVEGYSVVYEFAGHGVGLAIHEAPKIMNTALESDGPFIEEGMTFTIEPMINAGAPKAEIDFDGWTARTADGSLSAQFEHTLAVTKDGCEILTLSSGIVTV